MGLEGESYYPALHPKPYVSIGLPFAESCKHHVTETFNANKVYIIVSSSISKTDAFTTLQQALGDKVVGVRYGIRPHVPWPDVLEVAADLRDLDADLVVTLGAGSLTDGAKVATFAAANGAFTTESLEELYARMTKDAASLKGCTIRTINIPTSLSGGEYAPFGGATDWRNHRKTAFRHPTMGADLVILDAALTVSTPERVWLSSGMRAVDHCVEALCSSFFRPGHESEGSAEKRAEAEKFNLEGLGLLLPNLLITKERPDDLEARRSEMLGVIAALRGQEPGPTMGASHAIGRQLGPLGVGHGETSCIMLPPVLRWNREHGDAWMVERQKLVLGAFWGDATVADALKRAGLSEATASAGDVVGAYVSELALPGSLKDVGIGRDKLHQLAINALGDRNTATNPLPVTRVEQVMQILELALGQ
ncbi:iron-containing alcohol dehydrogenase-like protein [Bombardia bombarda]|uniref:Iron-containing alcohol dehydrogenase-like protein n=1 Tax=Bombardia bombarda TaxID=252184 RepID=A0AA39WGU8_9PEZI|nr:iron-containing alcohol dehydrogenase-like protein [Bombardia bombarda]